jgi:hypothetical protein
VAASGAVRIFLGKPVSADGLLATIRETLRGRASARHEQLTHDALCSELFNIGLHRAAAALSELTGQRIIVDLPAALGVPDRGDPRRLVEFLDGDLATVHQLFRGTSPATRCWCSTTERDAPHRAHDRRRRARSAGGSTSRRARCWPRWGTSS